MSSSNANPVAWAQSKTSLIAAYLRNGLATWLARAAPVLTPGAPVAAWIGVACNGGINENTTGWITGSSAEHAQAAAVGHTPLIPSQRYSPSDASLWSNRGFHELGPFGDEGGAALGPAPGEGSGWARDAATAGVAAVLGRQGTMAPGGWRAVEDGVVVGLAGLVRHAKAVRARLSPELQWEVYPAGHPKAGEPARWTQWVFVCAVTAWSAGDTGAERHLERWPELGGIDEQHRFGAWLAKIVTAVRPSGGANHGNIYYSAARIAQKVEAGRLAARTTGDAAAGAWLDPGLGSDQTNVYDLLTAGAYGVPTAGGGTPGAGAAAINTGLVQPVSTLKKILAGLFLLGLGVTVAIATDDGEL